MKIAFRDIEGFVVKPNPAVRVILVYGPDQGLMRERSKTMAKSVVADLNDPFNVAVLSSDSLKDDPARLLDEANAMSMMGGMRLVRIEGAGDSVSALVKEYLAAPNDQALVILEADGLGPRSSLRKLCEAEGNAAAIPCYVEDERDLTKFIFQFMQDNGKQIIPDAVNFLAANISGNRQKVRAELEKLVTYKGVEETPISLEDVAASCGQAGATNLDDLIYAVAGRNAGKAMVSYNQLLADGVPFIVILRSLQNHFVRLRQAQSYVQDGNSMDQAMKFLKPPVFFKQTNAFRAQADRWRPAALVKVMSRLTQLEAECKRTGALPEVQCGQVLLGIAAARG